MMGENERTSIFKFLYLFAIQESSMQVILGVIYHFIGGFASGSFYMPFKKVRGWAWESYWIIGGLFSWLIVPPLAAWLTIPHFSEIIADTGASTIFYTFIFGLLWGIGGCTYGLGVRYLGVALGSSIILGLCMVFGSLIPSIYYQLFPAKGKDTISMIAGSRWGLFVLIGLIVCIIGIILCGKAGMMKERQLKDNTPSDGPGTTLKKLAPEPVAEEAAVAGIGYRHEAYDEILEPKAAHARRASTGNIEYKFALGLTVAIISGVLSACFNFGLEAGHPMADVANRAWQTANETKAEFLFRNNVTYVVLLWGGLTTNFVWCMILNARNKTFGDYTNKKAPLLNNYLLSALAGTTWFLQFFFYGMGESRLGNGASSWILHMSFIILVANMWGLISKEWTGVSQKTKTMLFVGVATIIAAVLVVGYGNYIKP
jgi:L-rhamnose-H+ transport protein